MLGSPPGLKNISYRPFYFQINLKQKKAKEIEAKKGAQQNNARIQELEGLETSEFSIRVEIPTPTAKRCTMVAKTMQMLFKTMSQSTKTQIM